MTIEQITQTVAAVKPASRRQVARYLAACGIAPIGARQRPQNYPEDSAERILQYLGLLTMSAAKVLRVESGRPARLPSMRELKSERARAQKGRRK